jgi:hypothetical protein
MEMILQLAYFARPYSLPVVGSEASLLFARDGRIDQLSSNPSNEGRFRIAQRRTGLVTIAVDPDRTNYGDVMIGK